MVVLLFSDVLSATRWIDFLCLFTENGREIHTYNVASVTDITLFGRSKGNTCEKVSFNVLFQDEKSRWEEHCKYLIRHHMNLNHNVNIFSTYMTYFLSGDFYQARQVTTNISTTGEVQNQNFSFLWSKRCSVYVSTCPRSPIYFSKKSVRQWMSHSERTILWVNRRIFHKNGTKRRFFVNEIFCHLVLVNKNQPTGICDM